MGFGKSLYIAEFLHLCQLNKAINAILYFQGCLCPSLLIFQSACQVIDATAVAAINLSFVLSVGFFYVC